MKLGDLLPVFAATDAASATAERNGRFSEFPDKEPTVKQMSDWLDVNLPVITKAHGEMMRGALPPALSTRTDSAKGGGGHGSDGLSGRRRRHDVCQDRNGLQAAQ